MAAAPAVGEHDDRRLGAVARQIPHRQLRAVGRAHDLMLGSGNVRTPAEGVPLLVRSWLHTIRSAQTATGDARRCAGGQQAANHEQAPPAGATFG